MLIIAVDGPAGAGKSTIVKKIAQAFDCVCVDTGAIYRTVGVFAARAGIPTDGIEAVVPLLEDMEVRVTFEDGVQKNYLNGEEVSAYLRTEEISKYASVVSALPAVRAKFLSVQRDIAKENSVVMDGRDIGTVVFPNADAKIFLTATPEERARRRYVQYVEEGMSVPYEEVLRTVKERDARDEQRAAAPLKPAEDAILVDTTDLNEEESVELVIRLLKERLS